MFCVYPYQVNNAVPPLAGIYMVIVHRNEWRWIGLGMASAVFGGFEFSFFSDFYHSCLKLFIYPFFFFT
jgi:hypothetical protein